MLLTDIFSTPILLTIALITVLFACLVSYISYRMMEQDHKIASMTNLIQAMAEEMQYFRSKVSHSYDMESHVGGGQEIHTIHDLKTNGRINVSDDDSDHDSDDDSIDDSDDDSIDDSDDESIDDSDDESIDDSNNDSIADFNSNILNISLGDEIVTDNFISKQINHDINEVKNNQNEDINDLDQTVPVSSMDFLKVISINENIDVVDTKVETDINDLKKMSLNKLRHIVEEKALVVDASKLKKQELLKLLGYKLDE